jgi:energy-coupling factor transport system permease protein
VAHDEFHPLAWVAWLGAAALPPLLTRNPLYLSLTLLAVAITYLALGQGTVSGRSPLAHSWGAFVRLGAALWLLTIPFTALTSHYGNLVLLRLPANWPIVGGPITGEALIYGLSSGLQIITLLLAFAAFNVAVDQARLLRLTPAFIYQMGVTAAIAVGFVPQMVAAWEDIREAQQVRGHRVRGLRDMLPLIMPLLITALERAVHLAESMEARGFGSGAALAATPAAVAAVGRQRTRQQVAILLGLMTIGIGLAGVGFWPDRRTWAGLLAAAGGAALAWSFWDQGRRVQRSRYRRWYWTGLDRAVLAVSLVGVGGWLAAWLLRADWLFFYPYPPYSPWPTFQPFLGLLAVLAAAPGLLIKPAPRPPADDSGDAR